MGKTVTRNGTTFVHDDELLGEQGLRIRAVEFAMQLGANENVDVLLTNAEKILQFITPEETTD